MKKKNSIHSIPPNNQTSGNDELMQSILHELKNNGLLDELTENDPYIEIQHSKKTVIYKIEEEKKNN